LFALSAIANLAFVQVARADDFDPRGRKKVPASAPKKAESPHLGSPPPHGATGGLIERYTAIVLAQPGVEFPLQRLAQLYRERDGNLEMLRREFEVRSNVRGPEQYAVSVALAGIARLDAKWDEAIRQYETAIALSPANSVAFLALAHLLRERSDPSARARYEQALARMGRDPGKDQTLRTLRMLALEADDFNAAKTFQTQLVAAHPESLAVRGELARDLVQRGLHAKAVAEFEALALAASGDPRALAPILKDLGHAQAQAGTWNDALATLKRALSLTGSDTSVRGSVYEVLADLYRTTQRLPELVAQLESEHPRDATRLRLLAALYEETGDVKHALSTYRAALAVSPNDIDLRLKVIRILEAEGDLERSIAEYDALIRVAPNEPRFIFEQCQTLMLRGERARAISLLERLLARAQTDEDVLARVSDMYAKLGENKRARDVLARLASLAVTDPGPIVDLGERFFQEGNRALALQTWRRILTQIAPRARALAALGDVFSDHDMLDDALVVYKEARQLEPTSIAYAKSLANALERAKAYDDATSIWHELGSRAKELNDKVLAREVRTHVIALWGAQRTIETQIKTLSRQFDATPADADAGLWLAEAQVHTKKWKDAARSLRALIALVPGDAENYLALERVLVQTGELGAAIDVLEKLAHVDPKRARDVYQRMSQYALSAYRDDDAVRFAAKAVELNPDDAEGHKRLGELYQKRQDVEHAVSEFRAAIAKNDRLHPTFLELADLLVSKDQIKEADALCLRVVRSANDDDLVARAARRVMQIHRTDGANASTLEALESVLVPLAIGQPQRNVFRRLLVEAYANLTFELEQQSEHGSPSEASQARDALGRIGGRAVKPMMDVLGDGDPVEQRVALDVLGRVQNKNAGPALIAFATGVNAYRGKGASDTAVLTRAMLAAGALRDVSLLPRYAAYLFPKEGTHEGAATSDTVAAAAAWAVANVGHAAAIPLLRRIFAEGSPSMRAFAAMGLGAANDVASTALLAATMKARDMPDSVRAACAFALRDLHAAGETEALLALAKANESVPRRAALLALGRVAQPTPAVLEVLTDAVFAGAEDDDPNATRALSVRRAAVDGLALLALSASDELRVVPPPDETMDVEAWLLHVPSAATKEARARALEMYATPLTQALMRALSRTKSDALVALSFLDQPEDTAVATMRAAAAPAILNLLHHADAEVRARALLALARTKSDASRQGITEALDDRSEVVQRAALRVIGTEADAKGAAGAARVLAQDPRWEKRVLAAVALGRFGVSGNADAARAALLLAVSNDSFALVRQAALVALSSFDARTATQKASELRTKDPEARVRETAAAFASQTK
jgi:tetratricopeptide (TPR) repeat protein